MDNILLFILAILSAFGGLIISVRILAKIIIKTFYEEKNKQDNNKEKINE